MKLFLLIAGLHVAMCGPQKVRRGRHDVAESSDGGRHRREPEETLHGRLDLHLYRTWYGKSLKPMFLIRRLSQRKLSFTNDVEKESFSSPTSPTS